MMILQAIKSGFSRSLRTWKGILILWFISFLTVSLIVVPLKASFKSGLDHSMITEKLIKGINVDVLGDLGTNLHSLTSYLFSGVLIMSLTAALLNIFIAGGLFNAVRKSTSGFIAEDFFRASVKNFRSYIIITSILYLITIALLIIVVIVPVTIAYNAASEGIMFRVFAISFSIFMLAVSVILLVADYARAWQCIQTRAAGFMALGFGFSQAFRTFKSSFPVVLIMIVLQAIVLWLVFRVISGIVPASGAGILLLFIISQLLVALKLFLKVMRYGSITSIMEENFAAGL